MSVRLEMEGFFVLWTFPWPEERYFCSCSMFSSLVLLLHVKYSVFTSFFTCVCTFRRIFKDEQFLPTPIDNIKYQKNWSCNHKFAILCSKLSSLLGYLRPVVKCWCECSSWWVISTSYRQEVLVTIPLVDSMVHLCDMYRMKNANQKSFHGQDMPTL